MTTLLAERKILSHPFVLGELACGSLADRARLLGFLHDLPQAAPASDGEVLRFIDENNLMGSGIGYLDAHLLASATLTHETRLWTRDRRLHSAARRLGLAATHP